MGETPADERIAELSVEEELHLKEDAMDAAPVGISISDPSLPDNPLIYVNDQFTETTGYERTEILGTNCRFLQGPETDMDRVAKMAEAVTEQKQVAVELKNYRKDGELFWNRVEIAPIYDESGDVAYYVGYQADVTDRKEAELALAAERQTLDHVLSRVTSLVPDIAETIVDSDTREDLEASIAERFATVPDLTAAWVGRYNPSTGLLRPVAGDNRPTEPLGAADVTGLAAAIDSGTVEVLTDSTGLFAGMEPPAATALVPLRYRDSVYGLLAVATAEADVFDERETVVLEAIGQSAGAAINALERVSLSAGESVIEVRLEVADPTMPLVELADSLSGEVTADGQATISDGQPTLLLTVSDVPSSSVAEQVKRTGDLKLVAGSESGTVLEWTVPPGPFARSIVQDAVRLEHLSATPSSVRLTFAAASEHMGNTVVGRFRDGYDGVELLAFHEVADRDQSAESFRDHVTDDLTDRQLEALQKAYVSGFFEWPRAVEGESLAAAMDIHPSTFHQHLRAAERKLISAYFEG
ncbi:bacterio-opsin activator domain-containing protein [Halodesulfurarchaeum sp. HSR-GB]|uniref:PAS domain-containing protein n=1 Tax=Halodesulfurarchaeum sp. HSR-GB TaxID=3074077 RepID=UPI002861EB86|nr:bacterio-opsin activator domain-containing protein [Halodesulfurarchaeum sp. HSR-GB]MDR5656273.1 bacterio-opsin activator domain-containing protein [Halodesulfurarchaeum sp. HSR-GB]